MDKLDKMISEALDDEDREILDRIGREQGYFEQAFSLFKGKGSWANWWIMFWQIVMFLGGIYAAVQFFAAADALQAVRWGLPATVLILAALVTKLSLMPALQANRVIHALKHLEMQVALLANKR